MTDAKDETSEVSINGEATSLPLPMSIAGLLEHLSVDRGHVAVEQNRKLVPKTDFAETAVRAGDQLEIVTFVGGG